MRKFTCEKVHIMKGDKLMEIDKEKLGSLLDIGLNSFRDTVTELITQRENLAYEKGIEQGMRSAIAALYEAGVGEGPIIRLLEKYWNVGYEDATECLFYKKRELAHMAVREYLHSQEKTLCEIQSFITESKLDYHSDLWVFWREPERLVSELNKMQP